MRIAITGADGFLGWHVRCRAFAQGRDTVAITRATMADPDELGLALRGVDAVIHCAGANRGSDDEVTAGVLEPARALSTAIARTGQPTRVVYANSTQSRDASVYGLAKQRAAELLGDGPGLSNVVLPNLFGEHGRPYYNSFVATFCHQLAEGTTPRIAHDQELALLHAQDAAQTLLAETTATGHHVLDLDEGAPRATVSQVAGLLREFDDVYRTGELPDIAGGWRASLFNTYRSFLFPARYPIPMPPRTDARGTLVECVRTASAGGQAFVSTTRPGAVRGEHLHLRKFERFLVVSGEVEICLRRLFTDEVVRLRVSGEHPAAVDMPTMWAHNMRNVGEVSATTFFWSNELLRADDPDTFACPVDTLVTAS